MSWREDLRRVKLSDGRNLIGASFRGVAFFVDTSARGGGRRTVVHEFPFQDDPFVEDLGRKARTFNVAGYVLGDDYLTQRDALLAALEDESGPGQLVHPYYGVRSAICLSVSVDESRLEGGFAKFSIEFSETPTQSPVPSAVVDGAGQVSTAADTANAATDAEFASIFNSTNLPEFALTSAENAIRTAAADLKAKLAPIINATQEAAQLTSQVALITVQAASLVRTPALILNAFHTALSNLVNTVLNAPGAVMNAMIAAYYTNLGPTVVATTATRATELANQTALTAALRRVYAIQAARLAPTVPYVTSNDAITARNQIVAMLDEQAGLAGDTAYPAIVDLRAQMMNAVPGTMTFANIITVTRSAPIPSLVLAYQLYGAVDLELDIVARNDIHNPAFVAGSLLVLSDDS